MHKKSDILILGICIILFFWWMREMSNYQMIPSPPPAEEVAENGEVTEDSKEPPVETDNEAVITETAPKTTPTEVEAEPAPDSTPKVTVEATVAAEFADLKPSPPIMLTETRDGEKLADFEIDPERSGITNVLLHAHQNNARTGGMVLGDATAAPTLQLLDADTRWRFSTAKVVEQSEDSLTIARAILGTPLVMEQSWRLNPKLPYAIDCTYKLTNKGTRDIDLVLLVNSGIMQPLQASAGIMGAAGIDQRCDVLPKGEKSPDTIPINEIVKADGEDKEEWATTEIEWLAVQNKYFVSTISSDTAFAGCVLDTVEVTAEDNPDEKKVEWVTGSLKTQPWRVEAGESVSKSFLCYIGPKHYDVLSEIGDERQSIMQFDLFLFFHFGWMEWISLSILWGLNFLKDLLGGSYGVAIIFLTLFIRGLFWPITRHSAVWSKRMQRMQPKMAELREKYKDDPQKMSQKTWELYREEKINPVGGCLPLFLQIPVFFALFNVLRSAIELRQVGFLWAADLSQPDTVFHILGLPFNPLALLMGATMVWQQKSVPTSADPAQQKMMLFMSLFFVVLLYTMPSGLTLYWTFNNLVSVLQYKVTHKLD